MWLWTPSIKGRKESSLFPNPVGLVVAIPHAKSWQLHPSDCVAPCSCSCHKAGKERQKLCLHSLKCNLLRKHLTFGSAPFDHVAIVLIIACRDSFQTTFIGEYLHHI
jgi:hypothetical protein